MNETFYAENGTVREMIAETNMKTKGINQQEEI